MRKELRIGMLTMSVCYLLKHFFGAPELIYDFFLGIGIAFMLLSFLPEKALLGFKAYKRKLFRF